MTVQPCLTMYDLPLIWPHPFDGHSFRGLSNIHLIWVDSSKVADDSKKYKYDRKREKKKKKSNMHELTRPDLPEVDLWDTLRKYNKKATRDGRKCERIDLIRRLKSNWHDGVHLSRGLTGRVENVDESTQIDRFDTNRLSCSWPDLTEVYLWVAHALRTKKVHVKSFCLTWPNFRWVGLSGLTDDSTWFGCIGHKNLFNPTT